MWYPNPRKAQPSLKRSPAKGRTIRNNRRGGGGGGGNFRCVNVFSAGFFFEAQALHEFIFPHISSFGANLRFT